MILCYFLTSSKWVFCFHCFNWETFKGRNTHCAFNSKPKQRYLSQKNNHFKSSTKHHINNRCIKLSLKGSPSWKRITTNTQKALLCYWWDANMSELTWTILFVLSQMQQFALILCWKMWHQDVAVTNWNWLEPWLKCLRLWPLKLKSIFHISIQHLAAPTWQPRF